MKTRQRRQPRITRYSAVFLIFLLGVGNVANSKASNRTGPCALSNEEVGRLVNEKVTKTAPAGNWGIASTCTYTTAKAPVAIELASVASTNLSTDRATPGAQNIPGLGDEAVWIPAMSRLAVTIKSKNKLLRIGVGLPVSKDKRREIAVSVARLALKKL